MERKNVFGKRKKLTVLNIADSLKKVKTEKITIGYCNQQLMGITEIMDEGPGTLPPISDLFKPHVSCVMQGERINHGIFV